MKFTYLLYVNEKGEFGLNELTNYLGDMFVNILFLNIGNI